MLNISANHLAKVETGSRCCSIELLQDLSSCLNVRTDYLLNGDAPHNNHLRERLMFLAQELEKITADLPVWGYEKSRILFFNAQKRGRIGKRFSI